MATNVEVVYDIKRVGMQAYASDLTINSLVLKRAQVIQLATVLDLMGLRQKADVLMAAAADSQALTGRSSGQITVDQRSAAEVRMSRRSSDRMKKWDVERMAPFSDRVAKIARRLGRRVQAQDSTADQLERAVTLLNAAGLYDAADYIKQVTLPEIRDEEALD